MADDPTTTGAMQPGDMANVFRALPGATVTERWPFEFKWLCDLTFSVADNALTITLEIDKGPNATRHELPPVALSYFGTPDNLNNFLTDLKRNFFGGLRSSLTHEATLHLLDVRAALCSLMELEGADRASIIARHTAATAERLTHALARLPERQKSGAWTKIALKNAVQTAALKLLHRGVKGRKLTLDAVNAELRAEYGDQAPQSGEALRKQLEERELSWRALKSEIQRYVQSFLDELATSENGGKQRRKTTL
jgi:hypothetical protein